MTSAPPQAPWVTGRHTAPEYAVLLAAGRPLEADVVRAALIDVLARGALVLEPRLVPHGRRAPRPEHLLAAGPTAESLLPVVLRPARAALNAALSVPDVEGREGVRVGHWVIGLTTVTEGQGYLPGVIRPALAAAGLLEEVRRRMLPGRRWVLTDAGRSFAAQARNAVQQARAEVRVPPAGWAADPAAAAAAVAALGSLGVLALADPGLVAVLVDLRRAALAGGDTVPMYPVAASDSGSSPDSPHDGSHDPGELVPHGAGPHSTAGLDGYAGLDGLDGGGLGAVDAGTGHSGGQAGGSDGGFGDSGGSDGGGGGGGGGGGD